MSYTGMIGRLPDRAGRFARVILLGIATWCATGCLSGGVSPLTEAANLDAGGIVGGEAHFVVHRYTYGGAAALLKPPDNVRNSRVYRARYALPAVAGGPAPLLGVDALPPVSPPREGAIYLIGANPDRVIRVMPGPLRRPRGAPAFWGARVEVLGPDGEAADKPWAVLDSWEPRRPFLLSQTGRFLILDEQAKAAEPTTIDLWTLRREAVPGTRRMLGAVYGDAAFRGGVRTEHSPSLHRSLGLTDGLDYVSPDTDMLYHRETGRVRPAPGRAVASREVGGSLVHLRRRAIPPSDREAYVYEVLDGEGAVVAASDPHVAGSGERWAWDPAGRRVLFYTAIRIDKNPKLIHTCVWDYGASSPTIRTLNAGLTNLVTDK